MHTRFCPFRILALAAVIVLSAGCALIPSRPAPHASAPAYAPPTLMPTQSKVKPQPTQKSAGEASSNCTNNLSFVQDGTIPDGTKVQISASIDKRWEVNNSGTCNWTDQYRVRLIAGDPMGAEPVQTLFPARSGAHATLRIQFTAPAEIGRYRSAWQAYTPDGKSFGDPFYIEIVVISP